MLLHGFDGSLLEFRRLVPELVAAGIHIFAVDLAGWGFTCSKLFDSQPDLQLGPQQKSDHLYEFWKSRVHLTSLPELIRISARLTCKIRCDLCGLTLHSSLSLPGRQFALHAKGWLLNLRNHRTRLTEGQAIAAGKAANDLAGHKLGERSSCALC